MARELAAGDIGGLAVIEGIMARRIRETLQGEPCDMLELVHIKPPRGSKFLRSYPSIGKKFPLLGSCFLRNQSSLKLLRTRNQKTRRSPGEKAIQQDLS